MGLGKKQMNDKIDDMQGQNDNQSDQDMGDSMPEQGDTTMDRRKSTEEGM